MSWKAGLVNAFPIPFDNLSIKDQELNPAQVCYGLQDGSAPFPFFSLPPELRNRIYALLLFSRRSPGAPVKSKTRTAILYTSKRCHQEAAYVLYTSVSFRVLPLQDFSTIPTVRELPMQYRKQVANLEVLLGSSWTCPPKSWKVTKLLAKRLSSLEIVQTLRVFVQADPSQESFAGFRVSETYYTDFCGDLLDDLLKVMPQLRFVELDGNPAVERRGPLVSRLRAKAEGHKKIVKWGKERGWVQEL